MNQSEVGMARNRKREPIGVPGADVGVDVATLMIALADGGSIELDRV